MSTGSLPLIVTLDAKAVLGRIIRSGCDTTLFKVSEDGHLSDPDAVLHSDPHPWCPLFDQLRYCLIAHGIERFAIDMHPCLWFLYLDFSSLRDRMNLSAGFPDSPYGKALRLLVEKGFSLEDHCGRSWHYTVFDMSASNARDAVVSFLADTGYGSEGETIRIYDELSNRLCLGMDFQRLEAELPGSVLWNKYCSYRALYLSTAKRVPPSETLRLSKDSVLVLDTGDVTIACDVRRAKALCEEEDGAVRIGFYTEESEEGGSITSRLFDGEGLIAPDQAAYLRQAIYSEGEGESRVSSFQIRMPFAKGVVHEVDFHRFIRENLCLDEQHYKSLMIKDAFGVLRPMADVKMVLTTDMLKCHRWLQDWVGLSDERAREYATAGEADPMDYYFAKMREYGHALYVLAKRRQAHPSHQITTNAQFLSTLALTPEEFDLFATERFQAAGDRLFDEAKARDALLNGEKGSEDDAALYALERDARFIYDPYLLNRFQRTVNAQLVSLAAGNIPAKGALRLLSQDLLAFLCLIARRLLSLPQNALQLDLASANVSLDSLENQCLDAQRLYLPSYDEAENETGYLAVFRNPHLSRSEQCALRPLAAEEAGPYEEYLGHLSDVAMVSCASSAPMVLGGADYDGDTVHIYDDVAIVGAVLRGAYKDQEAGGLIRRFPIADLSSSLAKAPEVGLNRAGNNAPKATIGRHISFEQLLQSFQSHVGILSNSALRLSAILYGWPLGCDADPHPHPVDDLCANYTIAVGLDIDSVKTGLRPSLEDLRIPAAKQQVSALGITGKIVPAPLSFIRFRDGIAPFLRGSAPPIWEYWELDASDKGKLSLQLTKGPKSDAVTLDLDANFADDDALKGVSASNLQRLPWLMLKEAQHIVSKAFKTPSLITTARDMPLSPLTELYPLCSLVVDRQRLRTVKALVSAYSSMMGSLEAAKRQAKAAKASKAFGKARRRAQEYPTTFSEGEVDAILMQAVTDLREYFSEVDNPGAEEVLNAFEEHGYPNWALCPTDRRRAMLQEFLPGLRFHEGFYELIEDDALVNGAMIPFYLIGAALDAQKAQGVIQEEGVPWADANDSDEGSADSDRAGYVRKDPQMYAELVALANAHKRAHSPQSVMVDALQAALKRQIMEALAPDDRLFDYLCVLKCEKQCFSDRYYNSRALFWDLLSVSDMKEVLG